MLYIKIHPHMFPILMPHALEIDAIIAALAAAQRSNTEIVLLDTVDSTNDWCVEQARHGCPMPLACFAEQQTGGKGRRGRKWHSPAAANIYMSLLWQFNKPLDALGCLSLSMGMAVKNTLLDVGISGAVLKWPNDVLVDGRKIAGVLLETVTRKDRLQAVVIGIGVNYGMPDKVSHEQTNWADVKQLMNSGEEGVEVIARSELAGCLLSNCLQMCERYEDDADAVISELTAEFDTMQSVDVYTESGDRISGAVAGITTHGELRLIEAVSGEERVFDSADVSLRQNVDG